MDRRLVILILFFLIGCSQSKISPDSNSGQPSHISTPTEIPSLTPPATAEPTNTPSPTETPVPIKFEILDLLDRHESIEVLDDETIIFIVDGNDKNLSLNEQFDMQVQLNDDNELVARFGDVDKENVIGKVLGNELTVVVNNGVESTVEKIPMEDLLIGDMGIGYRIPGNTERNSFYWMDMNKNRRGIEFELGFPIISNEYLASMDQDQRDKWFGRMKITYHNNPEYKTTYNEETKLNEFEYISSEPTSDTLHLTSKYTQEWGLGWYDEDGVLRVVDYQLGDDEFGNPHRVRLQVSKQNGGSERIYFLSDVTNDDPENPSLNDFYDLSQYDGEEIDYLIEKYARYPEIAGKEFNNFRDILFSTKFPIVVIRLNSEDRKSEGIMDFNYNKTVKQTGSATDYAGYGGILKDGKFVCVHFETNPTTAWLTRDTPALAVWGVVQGSQTNKVSYSDGWEAYKRLSREEIIERRKIWTQSSNTIAILETEG